GGRVAGPFQRPAVATNITSRTAAVTNRSAGRCGLPGYLRHGLLGQPDRVRDEVVDRSGNVVIRIGRVIHSLRIGDEVCWLLKSRNQRFDARGTGSDPEHLAVPQDGRGA